jgi:hypothetical protein
LSAHVRARLSFPQCFIIRIEVLKLNGVLCPLILLVIDGWSIGQIGCINLFVDEVSLSDDIFEGRFLSGRLAFILSMRFEGSFIKEIERWQV